MPRGRPAKRDHSRKRDDFVFRTVEGEIESHPEERPMPDDLLPEGEEWHPGTRRWWKVWSESPLAKDLPESDWLTLADTAVIHNQFMRKRTFTLAGELRLRMAQFGATPADRMRLKIDVVQRNPHKNQPTDGQAGVPNLADRRSRLTG